MKKIILFLLSILLLSNVFCIDNDNNSNTVEFYLFISEGCPHCQNVEEYLTQISSDYNIAPKIIDVKKTAENVDLFKKTLTDFGSNSFGVPVVVINNKIFRGDTEIIEKLEDEIKFCEQNNCELYAPKGNELNAGYFEVTSLAITDSINPCALAVLLILLSAILLKFSRKSVLYYGSVFIITVFVCYFLMGLGITAGFKLLNTYLQSGTLIFMLIFGILAIILGILNLKDAISYGSGGFVMEVPQSWRPTMKKIIRDVTSIWSAIIIAIIVSFFLLPCTAGPYFLISGLLHTKPWISIIGWLLYYNIIFVLPMIIIMFVVYFGLSNIENLEEKRNKYIKIIHLIASIILIIMGIYLLWYVI